MEIAFPLDFFIGLSIWLYIVKICSDVPLKGRICYEWRATSADENLCMTLSSILMKI